MDIVIFGTGPMSRYYAHLLQHDSPYRPVAYTVHEQHLGQAEFAGLPVRRFEDIERAFPPEQVAMIAPLGWTRMGEFRREVVAAGRQKGYRFASYVSSRALTWPGFSAGENCTVGANAVIEPFARIGENCTVGIGALLQHDVEVASHTFVMTGAILGGHVKVGEFCVVGQGSNVADRLRIAPRCFIAAGAVVTTSTRPDGIYRGNPARRSPVGVDRFRKIHPAEPVARKAAGQARK